MDEFRILRLKLVDVVDERIDLPFEIGELGYGIAGVDVFFFLSQIRLNRLKLSGRDQVVGVKRRRESLECGIDRFQIRQGGR